MKYIWKKLQEIFWVHFFGHPYCSNGTKIHLDVELRNKRPLSSLTRPTQKSLNQPLAFLNLYQDAKTSMLEVANIRVLWPDWPHPFLTMPTQKYFDQLLIFVNLWICIKMPKISLFHLFILQIQSILKSHHMTGHTHFDHANPKNFQINFHEIVTACKK